MKWRLLVNPVSGNDAAPDYLPHINERLRQHVDHLDIVITTQPGDATSSAARSVQEGYECLIVAGGDGTLNEVLNGVASVAGGLQRTVLGVLPLGTGNDLASALGFPADVDAAIQLLANDSIPVAVDVGVLNGRCFLNVSGGGFIAEVSDAVSTQLKSIAGKLAYLIGGAQVLLSHEPVGARVLLDAATHLQGDTHVPQPISLDLHAFAVCNSRQIGGGRLIAPHAAIDDGLLDVCLIGAMPVLEFVALLRRVSTGEHVTDERVQYFQVPSVDFHFDRTIKVNTDGQVLETTRCEYRILRGAARVLAVNKELAVLGT